MEFNIADLFESVADAVPDKVAIVSGPWRRTFRELDARANQLAHWLAGRGIKKGDHVGLHLWNGDEYVEAMLACFKIRAVPININYRYVADELLYLFDNADLKGLVHQRAFTPTLAGVLDELPALKVLLSVDDDSGEDWETIGSVDYELAMLEGSPERGFPKRSGDDVYMVYTGGTTGMPRGVMWRHEDVFFAGLQGGRPGGDPIARADELAGVAASGDVALTIFPTAAFIHGAAQWAAFIALLSGGKVVIHPGRSFDPRRTWELVGEEGVHSLLIVGDAMARPLADLLAAEPGAFDTASLVVLASGGAVLSESVKALLREHLPGTMILNNFGASEMGHTGSAIEDGSGQPIFAMDATTAVLDDDLKPVAPGSETVGRLARRGRLPLGYYKDPEKTKATFVEVDGVRWVLPGDMAMVERDGTIRLLGRGAVCINTGGEKVYPEEVEEALKGHPAIFDAVVVGVPDDRWGQRVTALVQKRPGHRVSAKQVEAHARKHVAGYKVPRTVHFVKAVARHPSGKPDYRWAKETALAKEKA